MRIIEDELVSQEKKPHFVFVQKIRVKVALWSRQKKITVFGFATILSLFLVALLVYGAYSYWSWNRLSLDKARSRYTSTKDVKVQLGEPRDVPSPLNGVFYTKSEADIFMDRRPLAIMVNNHVAARPQFGLSDADIVYEAVAEGGITRFLAVYHARDSDKVGPVRSARVYYLDWAAELNAWYAHWGGSYMTDEDKAHQNDPNYDFVCNPEADSYAKINRIGLPSLDQNWLGETAYWRENNRGVALEHTGYTSTQKLYNESTNRYPEKGWHGAVPLHSWLFKDDLPKTERPTSGSLEFGFWEGYSDYDVRWQYDPQTNEYIRFQGGQKQIDAGNNRELRAKNVIIQFTKQGSFNDRKGHLKYETIGTGTAKIALDGKIIEAEWRKGAIRERTRYYAAGSGEEIKFNRGRIWVEIVPAGNSVSYSQ